MLEETILLKPELDKSGLEKMFRDLNKRFSNVAKTFGKGMNMAMRAAPFLAIASMIAAKLSSPLEKAEGIIDRILGKSGDLTDSAEELGTSPGALSRFQTLGAMKGVKPEDIRMMMGRFQTAVAEEKQAMKLDPKAKPGLLRNYVGETDMAEGLFSLLQNMRDMPDEDRVTAFNTIFGSKMKGKVQALVNEKNLGGMMSSLTPVPALNEAIARIDALGDKLEAGKAINESKDLVKKSTLIKDPMINGILAKQKREMEEENQALKAYVSQQALYEAAMAVINKLTVFMDDVIKNIAPALIAALGTVATALNTMLPIVTNILGWLMKSGEEILNYMRNFKENITGEFGHFFKNFKNITTGGGGRKK